MGSEMCIRDRLIPIGLTTALAQSSAIYVTLLSPLFLGEKIGVIRWTAVIIGLIGVFLMINPVGIIRETSELSTLGLLLLTIFLLSYLVYSTSSPKSALSSCLSVSAWKPIDNQRSSRMHFALISVPASKNWGLGRVRCRTWKPVRMDAPSWNLLFLPVG